MTIKEFAVYATRFGHMTPDKEALLWERLTKQCCEGKTKRHHFTAKELNSMLHCLTLAAAYWSLIDYAT